MANDFAENAYINQILKYKHTFRNKLYYNL